MYINGIKIKHGVFLGLMNNQAAGPVDVESSNLNWAKQRLWMCVREGTLTLQKGYQGLYTKQICNLVCVVLTEFEQSFVIRDDSPTPPDIFCTFFDRECRNGWLTCLKRHGAKLRDRDMKPLLRKQVTFAQNLVQE